MTIKRITLIRKKFYILGNFSRILLVFHVYLVYFYGLMTFSFIQQIFNTT